MRKYWAALTAALALAGCGQQEEAAKAPATGAVAAVAAPAPAPAAENEAGKSVYGKTCAMCHAAGVAGAPKPGDKADWAPRLAQGDALLYQHALEGFTGAKGMMPPRGGGSHSDADIKAAVDYMVAKSR